MHECGDKDANRKENLSALQPKFHALLAGSTLRVAANSSHLLTEITKQMLPACTS